MKEAPIPQTEAQRLSALYKLKILDTPSEERFDRITRLATRLFDVPIAWVSLVDESRQWFKSCQGLSATETPRSISFCGHTIMGDGLFVIPDAQVDDRFADNPLVTGEPNIRFYAGHPLAALDGQRIGTLCLIDHRPRKLNDEELDAFKDLAAIVERELNLVEVTEFQNELSDANLALEGAQRYEASQAAGHRLALLNEMGTELSQTTSVEEIFEIAAIKVNQIFGGERASIALLTPEGNKVEIFALSDREKTLPVGAQLSVAGTQIEKAILEREVLVTSDLTQSDFLEHRQLAEQGLRSTMTAPLLTSDGVIGTLNVGSNQPYAFTQVDKGLMHQIVSLLATTIESRRFFEQTEQAKLLLDKRVKELAALNELGQKMVETPPIGEFLQWVTEHIPPAMQYPHLCITAIEYDGELFGVPEAVELPHQITQGLRIGGRILGHMTVAYTEAHEFLDEESALLGDIGRRVTGYIENQQLFSQTEASLTETENLYAASRRINEAANLQGIVAAVAESGSGSIFDRATLKIFERGFGGEVEALLVTAIWHHGDGPPPTGPRTRYVLDQHPYLKKLLISEPLFFDDAQADAGLEVIRNMDIRAGAILPLRVGPRQIGVLVLESDEVHKFTEREQRSYISLAGQVAVAMENQRLLDETSAALAEVEAIQRRYTVQAWETYRAKKETLSYEQVREGIIPMGDELPPTVEQVIARRQTVVIPKPLEHGSTNDDLTQSTSETGETSLLVPLTVRGELIGVLGLQESGTGREWLPEEVALVETLGRYLAQAAENLRLIEATQQRVAQERRVNEIGEKIQAAQSLDEALKIAVKEIGLSLKTPYTVAKLDV